MVAAGVLTSGGAAKLEAQVLQEQWIRVQQSLLVDEPEQALARVGDLEEAAASLQVRRLTPYAEALAVWAQANPGPGAPEVLTRARQLDPVLPAPLFLAARWSWREGDYFGAMGSYLAGLWNLLRFDRSREVVVSSGILCGVLAVALSLAMVIVFQTLRYLRQIGHDAMELGLVLFGRLNAFVFAIVLILLPLFAGFGPVWLVVYLFVLGWPYAKALHRAFGVIVLCLLALVPPLLEVWEGRFLRTTPVTVRVSRMLEQRRVDFSTLREFADLESELGEEPGYNLVLGELLRMHGELDRARLRFQQEAVSGPSGPEAFLFLGSISMEEGDFPRAIQYYNQALDVTRRSALAHLNLSFAYDQSRRFQEGDDARREAREIVGRGTSSLGLPGSDPRIRYPRIGREYVDRMVARTPRELRLALGVETPSLRALRSLSSPLSISLLVCMVLGCIILVVRRQLMWTSSVCTRCGKVFCPRCKSSTESMSYCSQCISVFLKRDVVSIDQQTSKLNQVRRWEMLSVMVRRLTGALWPGVYAVANGRVLRGQVLNLLGTVLVFAAFVWMPLFMTSAEPLIIILPLQVCCLVLAAGLWFHSIVASWYGR